MFNYTRLKIMTEKILEIFMLQLTLKIYMIIYQLLILI